MRAKSLDLQGRHMEDVSQVQKKGAEIWHMGVDVHIPVGLKKRREAKVQDLGVDVWKMGQKCTSQGKEV